MDLSHLNLIDSKTTNKIHYQQFMIAGPAGDIECLLSTPIEIEDTAAIAIICHPHPLYSGTMHNKVVFTTAKTFNKLGFPALRFNFRGVERSQGEYDKGIGEKEDLYAATQFMENLFPDKDLWLAGFSFGSYIAASMQQRLKARQLITIAPAVTSFDFSTFPAPDCPWLLIQGLADEVIDAQKVLSWANEQEQVPEIKTLDDTSHFFHRRLIDLAKIIEDNILQSR